MGVNLFFVFQANRCPVGYLYDGGTFVEHNATGPSGHLDGEQFAVRLFAGNSHQQTHRWLFDLEHQCFNLSQSERATVRGKLE